MDFRLTQLLTTRQDDVTRRAYAQSEATGTLQSFYCTVWGDSSRTLPRMTKIATCMPTTAGSNPRRCSRTRGPRRIPGRESKDRRKMNKREEKKLRKAAGVKLITTQNSAVVTTTPGFEHAPAPSGKKSGFIVDNWSTISSSPVTLRRRLQKIRMDHCLELTGIHSTAPSLSEPPLVMAVPPPLMTSTSGFRSRGWTTLDVPPFASTSNRPLTPNVNRPILLQDSATLPPEPSASGFKPTQIVKSPAGIQPQPESQAVKNRSPSKRVEALRSDWWNFCRRGSGR